MIKVQNFDSKLFFHAAEFFKDRLTGVNNAIIFLSGGSCVKLYSYMLEQRYFDILRGKDIVFFQIDERLKPDKLDEINANRFEKIGLLEYFHKYKFQFFRISQNNNLYQSVSEYNKVLEKQDWQNKYKFAFLGIGQDAHTAGILPGYKKHWDTNTPYTGYKNSGEFPQRITVTPNLLKKIDQALVLVQGTNKRKALERASNPRNKGRLNQFPATILQEMRDVFVFTDIKINKK